MNTSDETKKRRFTNSCSVPNCRRGGVPPLYRFPNPKKQLDRLRKWRQVVNNERYRNLTAEQVFKRGFVCKRHFLPTDFFPNTHRLRESAIPSVNLPDAQPEDYKTAERGVIGNLI